MNLVVTIFKNYNYKTILTVTTFFITILFTITRSITINSYDMFVKFFNFQGKLIITNSALSKFDFKSFRNNYLNQFMVKLTLQQNLQSYSKLDKCLESPWK